MGKRVFQNLRIPVICAPMFLVSGPDLVIAACRSGIVGALPAANARPIEVLDSWMREIAEAVGGDHNEQSIGPWAINLMTHSSNRRMPDELRLIERYRPPVVITALGSPRAVVETVHGYGGVVIADVINLTLAKKAASAGVDGLACVCAGAGGHTGSLSPFAFASAVREFFDGLLVLAGGIADGFGIAGAIAAGADLVYVGTRFIPSMESLAPIGHKEMVVACDLDDLVVTASVTGTPASWLKPSLTAAGLDLENLPDTPQRNYDGNRPFSARRWVDTWSAGQGLGAVRRIHSVAEIVTSLEQDYRRAMCRIWSRQSVCAAPVSRDISDDNMCSGRGDRNEKEAHRRVQA